MLVLKSLFSFPNRLRMTAETIISLALRVNEQQRQDSPDALFGAAVVFIRLSSGRSGDGRAERPLRGSP